MIHTDLKDRIYTDMKDKINTDNKIRGNLYKRRNLIMLRRFNHFFRSNIQQQGYDQNQSPNNLSSGDIINKIHYGSSSNFSSANTATLQESIASKISTVNTRKSPIKPGTAAIHRTTKFEQTAEKTFNWLEVMVNINTNLTRIRNHVNGGDGGQVFVCGDRALIRIMSHESRIMNKEIYTDIQMSSRGTIGQRGNIAWIDLFSRQKTALASGFRCSYRVRKDLSST